MGELFTQLSGTRKMRTLMIGLDASGKTTALYTLLKSGRGGIGFNVETITYKNINFIIWDLEGREKYRPLWRHYYHSTNTEAVIYVVDSRDRERMDESALELHKVLRADELKDAFLLVLCNKQDLPNVMSVTEITDIFGLHSLSRQWYIQATCAISGDGLYEGLDWLSQATN